MKQKLYIKHYDLFSNGAYKARYCWKCNRPVMPKSLICPHYGCGVWLTFGPKMDLSKNNKKG